MVSHDFRRIPCSSIEIDRDSRQRRNITTDDLELSIARRGVIHPIVVQPLPDDRFLLITGERRLTTSLKLGLPDIPARLLSDLDQLEREILELEENVRRRALTWQEEVRAVGSIDAKLREAFPEKTLRQLAEEVGYDHSYYSKLLKVSKEMGDERISKLDSINTAYNMLSRREERKTQDAIAELMQISAEVVAGEEPKVEAAPESSPLTAPSLPAPAKLYLPTTLSLPESILIEDFCSWVESYSGPTFNFIHCDFPYGVNVFGGKWSGREVHETYDDQSEVYWTLLKVFCENLDRVMSHSAHLMFWYSMDYHTETLKFLSQNAPSLDIQRRPLVWLKSDNAGICPDPQRGPRFITETALIGSREDRKIVKVTGNAIAAPTDKRYHPSTKPEPMLRHFFQMFVDDTTRLFDPTCGSGAALRAAESLGAEAVLGLELDAGVADGARSALRDFRMKNRAAGVVR